MHFTAITTRKEMLAGNANTPHGQVRRPVGDLSALRDHRIAGGRPTYLGNGAFGRSIILPPRSVRSSSRGVRLRLSELRAPFCGQLDSIAAAGECSCGPKPAFLSVRLWPDSACRHRHNGSATTGSADGIHHLKRTYASVLKRQGRLAKSGIYSL